MSSHCSFRTGGCADIFAEPENEEQLAEMITEFRSSGMQYTVIGKGSNILVSDKGYRGAVIHIGDSFSDIRMEPDGSIYTGSGTPLSQLSSFAAKNSLKGLEFASGIPGTVGGGIIMNAGAYGGEIKDTIKSARIHDSDLTVREIDASDMELGYRHSVFQDSEDIILSAVFSPDPGDRAESERMMKEFNQRRAEKQPLNFPSAGSTFRRPEGAYAGTLIQECGLKGYSIGGAQVSEKHAGFIINTGSATSEDVFRLIQHVRKTVFEKTGFELKPEVKFIGEFSL